MINYKKANHMALEFLKENIHVLKITKEMLNDLIFSGTEEEEKFIFELYFPGETPMDAKLLATVQITKETGKKEISFQAT